MDVLALDELYDRAKGADDEVTRLQSVYMEAARARAELYAAIHAVHGESLGKMARRLGKSRSRVEQILRKGPDRRVAPDTSPR